MADPAGGGSISQRKLEHLDIAASGAIENPVGAGWDDVHLVHNCLPEVDRSEVNLSVEFLGRRLRAPVLIVGMTGGHPRAAEINRRLAVAAERLGIAIGVGSQRAAVEHPGLLSTYTIVREAAPSAFVIANVGAPQLVSQNGRVPFTLDQIRAQVRAIAADALAIHLNFLQEACQPEGDANARGCAAAIRRVCQDVGVPVVAKETGAGVSRDAALRLRDLGVSAIDVGGHGGSNMALMEARRAERQGDRLRLRLGETFAGWGLPTAVAVVEAQAAGLPIIATGGVRSGLDAAKAINLGATLVGVGRPVLAQAEISESALIDWLEGFVEEMRVAAFLTGSSNVEGLRAGPRRVVGRTAEWLRADLSASEV